MKIKGLFHRPQETFNLLKFALLQHIGFKVSTNHVDADGCKNILERPGQWFSTCAPGTSSVGKTWRLDRHASTQPSG